MRVSARNVLKGKVIAIKNGPVSTEVTIQVAPGIEVVSSITTGSATTLGLTEGKDVYAVIKASSVMVAID